MNKNMSKLIDHVKIAKLAISTQGVARNTIAEFKSISWIGIAIDCEHHGDRDRRIVIDTHEGFGANGHLLEKSVLRIYNEGNLLFNGTFQEMCENLKFGTEIRNLKK